MPTTPAKKAPAKKKAAPTVAAEPVPETVSTLDPTNPSAFLTEQVNSAIRHGVAVGVGVAGAWALKHGLNIDQAKADAWLIPATIGGYGAGVRALETRWPALGWLLGKPKLRTP